MSALALALPLCTPRLTLRDFVRSDFGAVHGYASDPDVTRFMFHGSRTVEDSRDYRIFSTCDVENAASARVLEKTGMTRAATLERHKYERGKCWTSSLYEVVRDL